MAAGSGPGTPSCRPRRQVVHLGLWSARGLAPVVQVSTVRLVASILSAPAGRTQSRARPTGRRQWCRAGISTVVSWVRRLCSDHQAGMTPETKAQIQVWDEDLARLWGRDNPASGTGADP